MSGTALADAERLQLAVQRRALHADEFGGARDVAAEAVDLGASDTRARRSRARRGAASTSGARPLPCPASSAASRRSRRQHLGGDRLGRVAAGEDQQPLDVVAELAEVARPVMRLEHRHARRRRSRRGGSPVDREICSTKWRTSSGMSSRRSASAGTRIGTTARRWNRSSRNVPSAISRSRSRPVEEMMRTSTLTRVAPPTRWKRLVDEHAQDLVLRLARHVADFVEIERAAVRLLERADLARPAPLSARCRTARAPSGPA